MDQAHLPKDHYHVVMTYAPLPSFADLETEFGKGHVSDIYNGRPWELHLSCIGMDRTPGKRTFYLHDVYRDWEREERINWGLAQRSSVAPKGYRPTTPGEKYEFAKAHPELTHFVALGSSTPRVGDQGVASVYGGQDILAEWGVARRGERILGCDWVGVRFSAGRRVLFVCR